MLSVLGGPAADAVAAEAGVHLPEDRLGPFGYCGFNIIFNLNFMN